MKKKKKKVEPIILNQVELMPTTIGSLENKENNPLFVIILFFLFIVFIFLLPYFDTWFSPSEIPNVSVSTPGGSEEDPNQDDEGTNPITYYQIKDGLSFNIESFLFQNFVVDNDNAMLTFQIMNQSGTSNYFKEKNYYIELYSDSDQLLQRVKLETAEIVSFVNATYPINEALGNGTISKIAIYEIKEMDYPNITLLENSSGIAHLSCKKDSQTIDYYFTKENDLYLLNRIEEKNHFENTLENYENILMTYTDFISDLDKVNGVLADLLPTQSGFDFELIVDLNDISNIEFQRYFTDKVYYQKNSEAKIIAFELESSFYTCN